MMINPHRGNLPLRQKTMFMPITWQADMGSMIQPVIIVASKRRKNINESWPAENSTGSSFWIKTRP
jgi:hypothetical protein